MNNVLLSDNLLRLRELSLHWAPLIRLLELLPQFRLVIDANVIIEELLFITQKRRDPSARTHLQEAIDSGTVVALAPGKLRTEISKHIPRLAAKRGVSEEALQGAWLEYQSRIRFVEVEPVSAEAAAAAVDPDDLPYVYLYWQVNADAVLSRDRHIPALGAASVKREVLIHVRNYAREKAPEIVLRVGSYIITVPLVAGLVVFGKIVASVAKGFARLPVEVQLALCAIALAAGVHQRSRQALTTLVSTQAAKLKEPAWVLLQVFGALAEELAAAERRVRVQEEILERSMPRAARGPLRLVALSVCLEAGQALTAEELTRGVLRAGYKSESAHLKHYLLRVLRQSELFISMPDGRWTVSAHKELRAI
jgi:predicted nucleic acid-binding protein